MESNSSAKKSNSTQSSNYSSSFCLSTSSSSQQKLDFPSSSKKTPEHSFQEIENAKQSFNQQHNPPNLLSYPKYFPPLDKNQCIIYPSNITDLSEVFQV